MSRPTDINRPIIEALYTEALVLADEVRAAFDLSRGDEDAVGRSEEFRLALSVEGLRTTTRIMHLLAWLLNQRAFFSGDMSEDQLRRHGTLPPDRPSDPDHLARFDPQLGELIAETGHFYDRVARIDAAWRAGFAPAPQPVQLMHDRLRQEVLRA